MRRQSRNELLSPESTIEHTIDDVHIGTLGRRAVSGAVFHLVRL
jgi:hypothetical protein